MAHVDPPQPSHLEMFAFFRMGLATGIVPKEAVVAWADNELIQPGVPSYEVIELSLSGHLPYSQLVWLLGSFQEGADYCLSLNLLLAQAGAVLVQSPDRVVAILMGLRLLLAEAHLPHDVKTGLMDLKADLDAHEFHVIPQAKLVESVTTFLSRYADYRRFLLSVP